LTAIMDVRPQDVVLDLWRDYKQTGSAELRNQLVLQYSPLVKYVAGRVRSELPANVESADLVSEGIIGLIDAIDKFEPGRGLQFQTYAVPRIRGAILDSIRAADWVPRSVRSRLRDIDRANDTLRHRLSRTPTDQEIADEIGISLADLRKVRDRPTYVASMPDEDLDSAGELAPQFDELFEVEETREVLLEAVGRLAERDQTVIALYFFENFTLGEIGQILKVTESRVSQLRTRAIGALRSAMTELLLDPAF
jgi:RNA polymerase sigma factor for flagellar operon FliA